MQDPTLAVKEGLREVETQLGKLRVLWSEAEFAKGAAEAEVKSLRAELARLRGEQVRDYLALTPNDVERFRARAKQDRRERFECAASLEAAHATIWGLGCVVTNLLHSAEGSARELKRLRRSNEQVREVLDAMEGESPVDAVNRFAIAHNAVTAHVAELERLRVELKNFRAAANLDLQASENRRLAETQAIRARWAKDREELLQRNRVVVDECDAALARVTELSNELFGLRSDVTELKGMVGGCSQRELDDYLSARRVRNDREPIHCSEQQVARDKALSRVEELEKKAAGTSKPPEGFMYACCYSARHVARNECAVALFRAVRPGAEPPRQGTYVFNTALAEVTEEINALRKDRETLNRVRGAVEVKS